jgi:hypothetical protein
VGGVDVVGLLLTSGAWDTCMCVLVTKVRLFPDRTCMRAGSLQRVQWCTWRGSILLSGFKGQCGASIEKQQPATMMVMV